MEIQTKRSLTLEQNPVFVSLFRVFVPLFRFLHYCSVFSLRNKNGKVCFCTTVPFLHFFSVFSTTEQKTEQCVFVSLFSFFVPLFRFLHYCSVFPQRNKNGKVCFCTTVLFCTSVPFFPQQNKNGTVFFFVPLFFSQETMEQKQNNVFLQYCFVFFFHRGQWNKAEQCVFLNHCSVFALLFRFLYHCSVFAVLFHFVSLSRFSP